jgi:pyruvate formate lyase activating enzyme
MSKARFWSLAADGRVECDLCPRHCRLRDGQRGFCFVRQNVGGQLELTTYGRSSGFCVDPVEKKPLNHFYPGTPVLSFGTAGCNLACRFCQNWDISAARAMDRLMDSAGPERIAAAAVQTGSRSLAYTYNDPIVFAEYAIDTAAAARSLGVKNIAVTAGYIEPGPAAEFFAAMDAANVDLKSFRDDFYRRITGGRLAPVLETIRYLVQETPVWVELTTLLIPGLNDSDAELDGLTGWVAGELGPDVPLHFTAFHPDHKLRDRPRTPLATLRRARDRALTAGLHFVYTGNVADPASAATYCPACGAPVIGRDGYGLTLWRLDCGACADCGEQIAGRFAAEPGTWGSRRLPVRLG